MWTVRWPFWLKDLPQTVHLKGFSPVWIRMCWSSLYFPEKTLPHSPHSWFGIINNTLYNLFCEFHAGAEKDHDHCAKIEAPTTIRRHWMVELSFEVIYNSVFCLISPVKVSGFGFHNINQFGHFFFPVQNERPVFQQGFWEWTWEASR